MLQEASTAEPAAEPVVMDLTELPVIRRSRKNYRAVYGNILTRFTAAMEQSEQLYHHELHTRRQVEFLQKRNQRLVDLIAAAQRAHGSAPSEELTRTRLHHAAARFPELRQHLHPMQAPVLPQLPEYALFELLAEFPAEEPAEANPMSTLFWLKREKPDVFAQLSLVGVGNNLGGVNGTQAADGTKRKRGKKRGLVV